jgi:hypothetical protein
MTFINFEELLSSIHAMAREKGSAIVITGGGSRYVVDSARQVPDTSSPGSPPGNWIDLTRKGKYVAHVNIHWPLCIAAPSRRAPPKPPRPPEEILAGVRARAGSPYFDNYYDPFVVSFEEAFSLNIPITCDDGSDDYVWELSLKDGKYTVQKVSYHIPSNSTSYNSLADALKAMKGRKHAALSCRLYVDRQETVVVKMERLQGDRRRIQKVIR